MNDSSAEHGARRRRVARDILRRMVAHVAAGGTTDLAERPFENDARVYTDPQQADLERRELFAKLPLIAGLTRDVPESGDSLLFDHLGRSIVIVRGEDGRLRGFLNMCMHRGTRIVRADDDGRCARRTRLTCPFHAWTYDLEGRLVGVPGRIGFEGVDLDRRRLVQVPVAETHGLIFVSIEPGTAPLDVDRHLGTFAPELAQLELEGALPVKTSSLHARCNWKYALDTYAEGYHFATLHAETIGTTHYSNVCVFDAFGPHWRVNFPPKSVATLVGKPESEWPETEYDGVHFVFPNVVLVVGALDSGERFVRMFRLFPGEIPGETTCVSSAYVLDAEPGRDYASSAFARDDSDSEVTQQDYRVAVDGYANLLAAPPSYKVVYGRNEIALQAFHRSIAAFLGIRLPGVG